MQNLPKKKVILASITTIIVLGIGISISQSIMTQQKYENVFYLDATFHPNFAGNIIVNLANLPDFLRKPILKKRMEEFFSLSEPDRLEVINNALEAGPTIPFPNFAKLFVTWLEILGAMPEEKRVALVLAYISEILRNPQKLILFNLDGILEIFISLDKTSQNAVAGSIGAIVSKLSDNQKRQLFLIIPQDAKLRLGL